MLNVLLITVFIMWGIVSLGASVAGGVVIAVGIFEDDFPSFSMVIGGALVMFIGIASGIGCVTVGMNVWPNSSGLIDGACYRAYSSTSEMPMTVGNTTIVVPYDEMQLMQIGCN